MMRGVNVFGNNATILRTLKILLKIPLFLSNGLSGWLLVNDYCTRTLIFAQVKIPRYVKQTRESRRDSQAPVQNIAINKNQMKTR